MSKAIIQDNLFTILQGYDDRLQVLDSVIRAATPTGVMAMTATVTTPEGWLNANGAAVNRADYPALFQELTQQIVGNTVDTSNVIGGIADTIGLIVGAPISGPGIPAGTTVSSIASAHSITISANATATATAVSLVIAPWGVGNGSSTFTLPNIPAYSGARVIIKT
jgi:hypothetical protein